MKKRGKTLLLGAVIACLVGMASQAQAGVLNGHALTFDGWTGTSAYSSGSLTGTIDFAVFTSADFDTAFPGLYTTTADELVYAYQVLNTGTDFVSQEIVAQTNSSAHDIGSFLDTAGEIAPSLETDNTPFSMDWAFNSPNIVQNEDSYILVYSSPNLPIDGASLTFNGGGFGVSDVPMPGDVPIPEPATMALLAMGAALLGGRRRRES